MDHAAKVFAMINGLRSIGFENIPALPGCVASARGISPLSLCYTNAQRA